MNKYKFVLKGKNELFKVNTKGDMNLIMYAVIQYMCQISIANDISKKEFLNECKECYEQVMKMINEEGRN